MTPSTPPERADAAAPASGASAPSAGGSPGPAPAGVLFGRWFALGWLVLFVLGCAAIALSATGLLQRLDLRAAFRAEPPAAAVDAPGEE